MNSHVRCLGLASIAVIALLAGGCDLFDIVDAEVTENVKREMGIDLNNPTEVIGLTALGGAVGDKGRETALNLVRDIRRVQHETAGDALLGRGDYDGAVAEYRIALRWAQPNPVERYWKEEPQRAKWRADVQSRLGVALFRQAMSWEASSLPVHQSAYLEPARHLEAAAAGLSGTDEGLMNTRLAAMSYQRAGDSAKACKLMDSVIVSSTTSSDGDMWVLWGCSKR